MLQSFKRNRVHVHAAKQVVCFCSNISKNSFFNVVPHSVRIDQPIIKKKKKSRLKSSIILEIMDLLKLKNLTFKKKFQKFKVKKQKQINK